jgi:hypothetical protein
MEIDTVRGNATARPPAGGADGIESKVEQGNQSPAFAALENLRKEACNSLQSLSNVIPKVGERIERSCKSTFSQPPKPEDVKQVDWVAVVNVTVKTFGKVNPDDITMRLKQLEELKKETEGKPVAVVVQTAVCDVDDKDKDFYKKHFVSNPYHVDRYIIYNGKMEKITSTNSAGYAGDVKDLLAFSTARFKADNMVLYNDSHGDGNQGLAGDTGEAKIPDFVKAVQTGLNGKSKLVIDFDACLMGQNGVMKALRPVTDHVVASAEFEGGLGQDFNKSIRRILANPKITPGELSDAIVETARSQKEADDAPRMWPFKRAHLFDKAEKFPLFEKSDKPRVPVKTLAHYDLTHYDQFRGELDKFGEALTKAIKDPVARGTVDNIIATVPYCGDGDPKRDLKSFVEAVLDAAGKGKLADPTGDLRVHGGRLLDLHKKLVPTYSGFYEYSPLGGLTFMAPKRPWVDLHDRARKELWSYDFTTSCENPPDLSIPKNRDEYIKTLDRELGKMSAGITEDSKHLDSKMEDNVKAKWYAAKEAVQKLKDAKTDKEIFEALGSMRFTARELEGTEYFQYKQREVERKLKKDLDEYYRDELVDPKDGWGKFREALRRLD